jgi:hypothetical protein
MIRFFKQPRVENCDCKAYSEYLFKPVRLPQSVYEEVQKYHMPMPIPKPTRIGDTVEDLHYMSFEEAQVLPFTFEQQPALKATSLRIDAATKKEAVARSKLGAVRVATTLSHNITKLKNKTAFKIAIAARVRGVMDCKSCLKPRCIYSQSDVSQMKPTLLLVTSDNPSNIIPRMRKEEMQAYRFVAKDMLHDATESPIFICGMITLDPDDPFSTIFLCDPSLACATHIEADFVRPESCMRVLSYVAIVRVNSTPRWS